MKILAVCLLLICTTSAQIPTSTDIQKDYDDTFNYFSSAASKFVDGLGTELEKRVNNYVNAHKVFIDQLKSISTIPNVVLNANSQKVITEGIAYLNALIDGYRSALKKEIFTNEFNKYMNMLTTQYLSKAQALIDRLKSEVAKNAAVGQCWTSVKVELSNLVKNGFLSARDAAVTTVVNANMTLNINEMIVKVTVDSTALFISSCQFPGVNVNSCISSFLNIAQMTIPVNVNMWASSTENALKSNLQLAEILINSAALNAMNGIVPIISRIESCVRDILAAPK